MTRIRFGAAAVFVTALSAAAPAFSQESITVGVLQPQQGECAQWGLPVTRGVEMWAEELNAAGGVTIASGEKVPLKVQAYDNVCYVPGEEIKAARRAVLDDGVDLLLQTYTPASRQAIAKLVTDNKVPTISYGAGFLSPDYPYLIGGITGSPDDMMYLASYIVENAPDAKRVAIISLDNSFGQAGRAYYKAGLEPWKEKGVEIVYDGQFTAESANDMLSLMTPLMQSKPDIILENGMTPGQKAVMVEVATQFGYEGVFGSEAWILSFLRDRVPLESLKDRIFMAYAIEASDPDYNARAHDFYKRYVEKYGEENWSVFASIAYSTMTSFEPALAGAAAPSGEAIQQALFKTPKLEHPIFGPSEWGGKEVFGIDNHLLTPLPIYSLNDKGNFGVVSTVDVPAWWQAHSSVALPLLKEGGQVFVK